MNRDSSPAAFPVLTLQKAAQQRGTALCLLSETHEPSAGAQQTQRRGTCRCCGLLATGDREQPHTETLERQRARKGSKSPIGTPQHSSKARWISLPPPLRRWGEADAVFRHVEDGVILLEEDVTQNPERLPVLGAQVGGLDAKGAVTIALQRGNNGESGPRKAPAPCSGVGSARTGRESITIPPKKKNTRSFPFGTQQGEAAG